MNDGCVVCTFRHGSFCTHADGSLAGGGAMCPHFQLAKPAAPTGANAGQVGGDHYSVLPIQTWDFITKNEIPFLEGNAIKYLVRHRNKGRKADLEKAIHYIQKAIEVYYP
jgi:hypothetical protein